MRQNKLFGIAMALGLLAANASAATIATFADPSPDGGTPLFAYDGQSLTGGWALTGLNLLTPGLAAVPDIANATFTMTPLSVQSANGGLVQLSGGQIDFFDGNSLVLSISFNGATLNVPFGFGSSDFSGSNVTFSGPNVPPLTQEAFAFSFANPQGDINDFTVTSSFTSSAVPEPASLLAMGGGLLMGALRRRR